MTISFSGLASGLDTTSWIKSLTALKQARVNTLSVQKDKISVSQNALNTIKSYFTNFRSSLEKLTDAKFGISTMDLFTQNLATTTNMKAFTATATTEAEEKNYTVKVNKLASATKAKSTHYSVVETKTTAVKESTFKDVGITDGEIGIVVDGVEKGLFVSQDDTISSFISKLKNIGVCASYNDKTGVFNINASVSDIKDYSNTGVVEKFNLVGVNEAYQSSSKLQYVETRTDTQLATLDTKISDLDEGYVINNGDYVRVENASGEKFDIAVDTNTTIGDFVNALSQAGLFANFDTEKGILDISGGSIVGGTFDAKSIFALEEQPLSAMATGNQLSETIIVPEVASLDSRLVEDLGVSQGYLEVQKPDGTLYYEKIQANMTMADFMADLGNLGINTSLDPEKGILTITGGNFKALTEEEINGLINSGTIYETEEVYKKGTNLLVALGFEDLDDSRATIVSTNVRSQVLTFKKTNLAYTDDLLVNYFDIPENNEVVIHEKTGEEIGRVAIDSNSTFESFFADLAMYDVDAQLHDGKIMIDSNRELYVTGDVITAMGMETTYVTTTVTTTVGKSQHTLEKTYYVTDIADNTSKINDFVSINSSNNEIVIKDVNGNPTSTITISTSTTFGDLFNTLAPKGVSGQMNDGVMTLVHNNGGYVDGSFTRAIGMDTTYNTVVTTTTVGGTQTTSSKTYSITDVAGNDSRIGDFLTITSSNNQLTVKDIDGHVKGNVSVTNDMTFRQLFAALAPLGVDGDIQEGQVTFFDNNGGYVDGSFATAMGVAAIYTTIITTTTVGGTQTTESKTFKITQVADDTSVINDFLGINSGNNQLVVKDVNGNAKSTVTVTNTMTFRDLFVSLASKGVYGNIHDGVLTLFENNGGYVDGSFATAMGMSTQYTTVYTATTVGLTTTGAARNYTVTQDATGSTTFAQIGSSGNKTWTIMNGQTGAVVTYGSFGDGTTIGQFADILGQYGMSASIDGGYFSVSSPQGYYVKGTAADALGLGTYNYTTSAHGSQVRTINATDTQVINQTRTLTVSSSGSVTISATQTRTLNQTRTLTATSSGYATLTMKQTISTTFSQVMDVTLTQNKTITTTIVTTMTVNVNGSNVVLKTTASSSQTVAIKTVGKTTMNVTRTIAVDVSRTVAVNTTGYTTVNIAQTLTIKATQTTNVNTTGYTTVNICQTMTITAHQTITVDVTTTRTVTANKSSSDHNTYKTVTNMNGNTKLSQVGLGDGTFTVVHDGTLSVVTVNGSTTVDSMIGRLAAYGIEASVNANGAMTFKGTNDGYIIGATGSASSLGATGSYTSSTQSVVYGVTSASAQKNRTLTQSMTSDTTFGNLGLGTGSATVVYNGSQYTISVNSANTMQDFMIALSGYGISASINANGQMTVTGTRDGYILSTTGAISSLGIGTSTVQSTTTAVTATNTAGSPKSRQITQTMTSDTTLAQLKWSAGAVSGKYQGNDFTIAMETNNTIGDLISALSAKGISGTIDNNGQLTLIGSADGYITGASGGLASGLGIVQSTVMGTSTVVNGVTTAAAPKERQVLTTMTSDTTFGDLKLSPGIAKINYKGTDYVISMNENNTMSDFMTSLAGFGISSNIKDGCLYVTGTTDGYIWQTSGGIKALGINTSTMQTEKTTTVGNNSTTTVFTRTTNPLMDRSTKLLELRDENEELLGITTGVYYMYRDGVRQTKTITADMTVNDLMAQLAQGGFIAEITESGSIAISGRNESYLATSAIGGEQNSNIVNVLFPNWVFDKTYDSKTEITAARTRSQALTINQTFIAESADALSNYIDLPADGNVYIHEKTSEVIGTVTVDNTSTFQSFFGDLAQYGIDAQLHGGKIMFDSNRELFVTGDLLDTLGMTTTYHTTVTTTTIGKTQTTLDKNYDIVDVADSDSVINDFLTITGSNNQIVVKNADGVIGGTVMVSATSTFGDVFNALAAYGVTGQMNDGIMTLVHNEGGYVDGSFTTAIGMHTNYSTVVSTTTVGSTQTTNLKTYNTIDVADNDSRIGDFLTITSSNNQLTVKDIDGHVKGNVSVTNDMTFRQLFAALAPLGVDGDIQSGQVTFFDNNGGYVDGSFAAAMGVATTYTTITVTTTVGGTQSTANKVYNTTEIASDDSVINAFNAITSASNQIVVHNADGSAKSTVTLTNTMTFKDLFVELAKKGVYGGMHDGVLTLYENNGGYVDGSFCQSMGMTTNYSTVYTTTTTGQTSTGAVRSYTVTYDATGSSTFKDIGSGGNKTWTIINGQTGAIVAYSSFGENTTIGQFADILGQYGFSAGIDGGYFTASSPQGYYVKGTAADALGLGTYTYTMSEHGTHTAVLAATDTQTVNQTRVLDVASSGYVTVNAKQTIVVNQTRTLTVASSGNVTVSAIQTITMNVSQTLAVTTTQTKTITTTIVSTMTLNQSVSQTVTVTVQASSLTTTNVSTTITTGMSSSTSIASLIDTNSIEKKIQSIYGSNCQVLSIQQNPNSYVMFEGSYIGNTNMTLAQLAQQLSSELGMSIQYDQASGTFKTQQDPNYGYYYYYLNNSPVYAQVRANVTLRYAYGNGQYQTFNTNYTDNVQIMTFSQNGPNDTTLTPNPPLTTTAVVQTQTVSVSTQTKAYTLTASATIKKTVTTTSTSTQTVTFQTSGTTTVNVSRTFTVNVSQTVACNTSGTTTVNIAQTITISATQTATCNTTGKTTVNIAQTLTFTAHQTVTTDITATRTITTNKSSADRNTYKIGYTMSGDTQLSQVGLGDGTITVVHEGTVGVVTLQGSSTIDSIIGQLGAYGIEASVNNGAMTFKGTKDGYIIGASGSGSSLGAVGTYSTSATSVVYGITSASSPKTRNVTNAMSGDTMFYQLGYTNNGTATVNYLGEDHTINMYTYNTLNDFMTALAGYGITSSIDANGKLTVTGTSDGYIKSTSGFIDTLGITTSTIQSASTVVHATNSAGSPKTRQVTKTMTSDTTLAQLGWDAGTVKGYYEGNAFSISMQTNNSIGDLISALGARGIQGTISNGQLTLVGSNVGYITEATGGLASAGLGIVTSTIQSTSTVVHGVTSAANSKKRNVNVLMNGNTTFANLALDAGTAKVCYQGVTYMVSMTEQNTMNDLMTALGGYGLETMLKDGRLTVNGNSEAYILSTTGGIRSLGIQTSTQEIEKTVTTGENGISTFLTRTTNPVFNRNSKLTDLLDVYGNNVGITDGAFYVYQNGIRHTLTVGSDWTINDLLANLVEYGVKADISEDGRISLSGQNNTYLQTSQIAGIKNSNIVDVLFSKWDFVKVYDSNNLSIKTPVVQSITRDTKLENISTNLDFNEGVITIQKDGVKTNLFINKEDTVGTLIDELSMHGFETVINDKGQLIVRTDGDSKLQSYSSAEQSSNILDILGINSDKWINTNAYESKQENVIRYFDEYINATEDTVLSDIKNNNALETIGGEIALTIDGIENVISIDENETVGSVLNKFRELGIEATIADGKILIQSGYKDIDISQSETTSALGRISSSIGFNYYSDIGGYASSNAKVISTTYENRDISVSNWADMDTQLSLLNITSGTFSVFRNGQKAIIDVSSDDTFATLQTKIQNKLNDVEMSFENGILTFRSNEGNKITTGSSTDSSNLSSITGLSAKGRETTSARELYKVNAGTTLTQDNLFREDNITEGTFTIGEQEFTIDSTTTLNDIINKINSSESAGATAYWDSVDGKLVLLSTSTGAKFVNIERGTSNFTDVMGLTTTTDGVSRMNTKAQKVGDNAEFTINGTSYTSTSNTINSDISRIKGVTLQLKQVSTEEESTVAKEESLNVQRDRESLANAMDEVVDSYNTLMENVDKAISAEGDLKDQTALKMIRNQLRSLMTSSQLGLSTFKNMDSIGVGFDKASGGNIATSNVNSLTFDRTKFYNAYDADPNAVKSLLVGTDTNKGVLLKIEDLVESALTGVTGYFDSQNNSYIKQIQQINDRISKEDRATLRYQEILESKFSAMDLLISQMQQQYSSFLIA